MAKTSSNPEEAAAGGAPPRSKGSILGKLLVLMLVVVVVAVECVVAYLCIPVASESAAAATNVVKPPVDHKKGEAEPAGDGDSPADVEVDLKEFQVTIYQPASTSTLGVNFHLHGIVAASDKKEFDHLFELNQNRFREQVTITVRSAEMTDLTDPSLGLLKRMILDKAQRVLGKPLLKEVIIGDYSSLEN